MKVTRAPHFASVFTRDTTTLVNSTRSFRPMEPDPRDVLRVVGERVFVLLALLLMALLSIGSFRSQAMTLDEIFNIPSGLSYWQKQDARLNVEHPPLLKMISAVPLLFAHVNVDYGDPSWCGSGTRECQSLFGKKFFEKWNANPHHLLLLARVPMLAVTLLLGFLIFFMARSLAGPWGGALSLILFATSPFYLGWGPLVLTDIGLPLFVMASVWTFASLWSNPNRKNMWCFAVCLACALVSKFSALLLLPTFFLLWLYFRLFSRERLGADKEQTSAGRVNGSTLSGKSFAIERNAILGIAVAGVLVYFFYALTCWHSDSAYIFSARARAFGTWGLAGKIAVHVSWFLPKHPFLARLLNPLWLYLCGVLQVFAELSRTTYVLGKWYSHGVWFYFLVVSFFKLAPGMIGCFALLIVLLGFNASRWRTTGIPLVPGQYRRHVEAMVAALIVFAGSAMSSNLNIGIRHFSVPISIVTLLCALVVPLMKAVLPAGFPCALGILISGGLASSSLATALIAYPYYISYYNFFRFGTPKQDIAANSNLYWGQSLIDVERFREEHHISKIYVDGRNDRLDPATYVSGASEWKCDEPEPPAPEWVAVSANFLLRDAPTCAGLLRYPHWYVSDESMVVFRITDSSYASDQQEYLRAHGPNHMGVLGW
jgi:hypothetical protein